MSVEPEKIVPAHGGALYRRGVTGNRGGRRLTDEQIAKAKLDVAGALAAGKTVPEAAQGAGVVPSTVKRWQKGDAEFKRLIEEAKKMLEQETLKASITDRAARIARLQKRWDAIDVLIQARADDPQHMSVPGTETGLLAHEQKSLGSGELATVVDVYRADVALLKEERGLAKQAAIEMGEWQEKIQHDFTTLPDEDLKRELAAIAARVGADRGG
jgi:hypothetical protein